jgi:hypothetical protein
MGEHGNQGGAGTVWNRFWNRFWNRLEQILEQLEHVGTNSETIGTGWNIFLNTWNRFGTSLGTIGTENRVYNCHHWLICGRRSRFGAGNRDRKCLDRASAQGVARRSRDHYRPALPPCPQGDKVGARLTDQSVADIVKAHANRVGLDPRLFSGHSLRSGFLTSAGASIFKMMDVSRHRSVDTL